MNNLHKISKYFSFLLGHKPDAIGLVLDDQGWASIEELISKIKDFRLTKEIIDVIVETNDKQRFVINSEGTKIRANQGHSIEIDLALEPQPPPPVLLHGTTDRFMTGITREGLHKQKRHHVHLTESAAVAKAVGSRYGKVVLLKIDSEAMAKQGYEFFKSANNVWLVESVPYDFISAIN